MGEESATDEWVECYRALDDPTSEWCQRHEAWWAVNGAERCEAG